MVLSGSTPSSSSIAFSAAYRSSTAESSAHGDGPEKDDATRAYPCSSSSCRVDLSGTP
jgi:hypothetical protein